MEATTARLACLPATGRRRVVGWSRRSSCSNGWCSNKAKEFLEEQAAKAAASRPPTLEAVGQA